MTHRFSFYCGVMAGIGIGAAFAAAFIEILSTWPS